MPDEARRQPFAADDRSIQNGQSQKLSFANARVDQTIYSPQRLQRPRSPYQLMAGCVMPDGSSVVLDNLPASDTQGYAGLEDGVDYDTWRLLKGVVLSSLLGISSELAANNGTQSNNNAANEAGQRIVSKDLAVQPTLTVRPGYPVRVIVNRDIVLRPLRQPMKRATKLKLGPIPDDKPLRLTITLSASLLRCCVAMLMRWAHVVANRLPSSASSYPYSNGSLKPTAPLCGRADMPQTSPRVRPSRQRRSRAEPSRNARRKIPEPH